MRASLFSLASLVVGEEDASLLQTASVRHNILTLINGLQRNPSIEIKKYVSDAPAAEALIQRAAERSTSQTVAANFMALPVKDQEQLIEFGRTSPEAHEVFAKLSPEARQAALLAVERHLDSAMLEKGVDGKGKKGNKSKGDNKCDTAKAKEFVEGLDFGFGGHFMTVFDADLNVTDFNIGEMPASINSSQCNQTKTKAELLADNPCYSRAFQALPYTHNGEKMADICFKASEKMAENYLNLSTSANSVPYYNWLFCGGVPHYDTAMAVDHILGGVASSCPSSSWDLKNFTASPPQMFAILPPKITACKDGLASVATQEECEKVAGFLTFFPDDDANVTVNNQSYHYQWNMTAIKYSGVKVIKYSKRPFGCYYWNDAPKGKNKVYWNNAKNGKPKKGRQPICSFSME